MTNIRLEWDDAKNRSNLRKHGVTFEDASQVFYDPLRVSTLDEITRGEERWQTIGQVDGVLILLVIHTTWDEMTDGQPVETIRIISARPVTAKERKTYEENG